MKKYLFIVTLMIVTTSMSIMASPLTASEVLDSLKARIAPDGRTALWNVNTIDQNGVLTLYGNVGTQEQSDAIEQELKVQGFAPFKNNLIVLENSVPAERRWAVVKLSIATMRTQGRHAAEMASQAIMGTPVKVIEQSGDWWRIQTPDHYIAYVPGNALTFMTAQEMNTWRHAKRYIVTAHDSRLVSQPKGDATITDLVLGNILHFKGEKGKWLLLATPDGREGYVEKNQVAELTQGAKQDFDAALIEKTARRLMGSSYLWGGTSTKVTDCSGLTKVSYFACGIILQRDASQQALTGTKIAGDQWQQCHTGDLLFFGNQETGRVTHVGIYLRDGQFIHCSGQVKINSLNPDDPTYLYTPLSCSRIDGMMGTTGIVQLRNHPWYF